MRHANHPGHHSDHSGAHMRGTKHHEQYADGTADAHQPNDAKGYPGHHGTGVESGDHDTSKGPAPRKHADMSLSEHPTSMELPAKDEGRTGEQANEHKHGSGYGR